MSDLNVISLGGRISKMFGTRKPNQNLTVKDFTIANSKKVNGQEKTSFINCTVFGMTAEKFEECFQVGSYLNLTGELEIESWKDQSGNWNNKTVIKVSKVFFTGNNKARSDGNNAQHGKNQQQQQNYSQGNNQGNNQGYNQGQQQQQQNYSQGNGYNQNPGNNNQQYSGGY